MVNIVNFTLLYFTAIKNSGRKKRNQLKNETNQELWFKKRVLISEDHKVSMRGHSNKEAN